MGTWKILGTSEVKQIDHVLVSLRHFSSVIDVRSCRGSNCDSDHYLVRVKVTERITKLQKVSRTNRKKWDVEKLRNGPRNQNRKEYQKTLQTKLRRGNNGEEEKEEELNVDEQWKKIEQAIKGAAEETIQEQKPTREENWFDEECAQIIGEENIARRKILERETRANTERYQELRRKANRICKKKKKDDMKERLEEIEQLSKQNERRKFYNAVEKAKRGFQPRIIHCKTKTGKVICEGSKVLERWEEHFNP